MSTTEPDIAQWLRAYELSAKIYQLAPWKWFEDRDFLAPEDMGIIKRLGLSFRGKNAWPCFRSYQPGQFPWFVDREELRLLTIGLEQVLAMAPRFEGDNDALERLNRQGMEKQIFLTPVLEIAI